MCVCTKWVRKSVCMNYITRSTLTHTHMHTHRSVLQKTCENGIASHAYKSSYASYLIIVWCVDDFLFLPFSPYRSVLLWHCQLLSPAFCLSFFRSALALYLVRFAHPMHRHIIQNSATKVSANDCKQEKTIYTHTRIILITHMHIAYVYAQQYERFVHFLLSFFRAFLRRLVHVMHISFDMC